MRTIVTKGKCVHTCKSEEQLARFLKAGWTKSKKQPKPDVSKDPEDKQPKQGEE